MQRKWLSGRFVACVMAAVMLAFAALSAIPSGAYAERGPMGHIASGPQDGNGHFGSGNPEAFVLSDQNAPVGDVEVGGEFYLVSDPAASRVRFVGKYVDDKNWFFVGCDTGNNWILQYKLNGNEQWPQLSGLPALKANKKNVVTVSHNGKKVSVTVNGKTATVDCDPVAQLMAKGGRVGFGGATFGEQKTDLYFTNVKVGDTTLTDFTSWSQYKKTDGQVWEPAATFKPAVPEGRKWIQITGGKNNGGGHEYGNPSAKAPALLLDGDRLIENKQTLELTLVPVSSDINFGVFYTYVDNDNWMYIGWDSSSGWYCQYEKANAGAYPRFESDLPTPAAGVPLDMRISVDREKVELTVNGKTASMSQQAIGDFMDSVSGKGHPGVKVNGTTSVKFADAKVADASVMEDEWSWAAERDGQVVTETYVNLAPVSGTVTGKDKAPLKDATVRVGALKTKTDEAGHYAIENVEVGKQKVTVSYPGYQAKTIEFEVKSKGSAGDQGNVCDVQLEPKPEIDLSKYKTIASDEMTVYVSETFPQVVRYDLDGKDGQGFLRAQESDLSTLKINGAQVTPQVKASIAKDTAQYTLTVKDDKAKLDATIKVEIKVEGTQLTWRVTSIDRTDASDPIKSIDLSGMNLVSIDQVDGGQGFAGAQMSTNTMKSGDKFYSFEGNFNPSTSEGFLYGFLSSGAYSAGIFSNSEAEGDRRITLNSGSDTMGLASSVWYYEHGDKGAQNYIASHKDVKYPKSELPWVKVAIAKGDVNEDGDIDWNDGAVATRKIINHSQGSENIKNLVNYRVVMNFGSEVSNPYALTADNLKKVALATDGLPQALLLKGYGNEGHDSANSEYADISSKEGGVKGFKDLIRIAHQYNTEVGIHINAQEAYPESKSFNERMVQGQGDGWGWLDQSVVIDKLWDLGSDARWNRLVQLYDRINGTHFANKDFAKGEYVGDPAKTGAKAEGLAALRADAAKRKDNMDFIYLDVWYQDAWETRRIADQINSLGWRFSTEFSQQGEYNSTWGHWATDIPYGGSASKGINSDIVRFLRNDQRDTNVNNGPVQGGAMDNPLLGGYVAEGFEGWGGDQNFDSYIKTTFLENVPTRFLQHYLVVDWDNYDEGASPAGNHEKQITLKSEDGKHTVVVKRNENKRSDSVIERTITLDGKEVLKDGAYLLPWTTEKGEQKLYHFNVDGGSTTWNLGEGWDSKNLVVYKLSDQGRQKVAEHAAGATLTIDAEPGVAYVVVPADAPEAPSADTVNFGEGTGVVDPGFNTYADGEPLNAQVWSGDIDDPSVKVTRFVTGDQRLTIDSPQKNVTVSTALSGLTKGKTYVAEAYLDNRSDATATIRVTAGSKDAARSTGKSVVKNYTCSDEKRTNGGQLSYMTRVYVKFTAESDTATFSVERAAGEGSTYVDNIRVVEAEHFPVQDKSGNFTQDFENAVSGLYPFVVGPAADGGDTVTHLSERHGEFTQSGWRGREIDDVLDGNWSLKHHDGRSGLLYQTTPQTLFFTPNATYKVEFDYQTGSAGNTYQMVVGDGENGFEKPSEFLPVTYSDGHQTTKHKEMQFTASPDGATWVGLYSGGNGGNTHIGASDIVIDNFKVTLVKDAPRLAAPANVQATDVTETSFKASWEAPAAQTQADAPVLNGYKIYLDGKFVASFGADVTSYAFEDLKPDTAYEFGVTAVDQFGNESDMSSIQVKTKKTDQGGGSGGGSNPDNGKPDNGKPDGGKPNNGKPNNGAGKPSGSLVQTGDTSFATAGAAFAAALACVAGGIVIMKKRRA